MVPESQVPSLHQFLMNNKELLLPVISSHYSINIKNNFAEIKSVQTFRNPFNQNVEVHYSVPTDPNFCLTRITGIYEMVVVEGQIKRRENTEVMYQNAHEQGNTAVAVLASRSQISVLKVRLGNLQPSESVRIQFDLIGKLTSELPNTWTLRIPSHIGPRHQPPQQYLEYLTNLKRPLSVELGALSNIQWSFEINLSSSKGILSAGSSSHLFEQRKYSHFCRSYALDQENNAEKDLEFTFEQQDFTKPICTVGNQFINITLFPPKPTQSNFNHYKGEYLFLVDRSGLMGGDRIQKVKQSLILFLVSLPEPSFFNIISFGTSVGSMFKRSVQYNDKHVQDAVTLIQTFTANMGGLDIKSPLQTILRTSEQMSEYKRHVILLTCGQVSNAEEVINVITQIKKRKIAAIHMVGIGDGISFDMIRRGSSEGGGKHLFVKNNEEIKRQIIFLLQYITSSWISNSIITFDQDIFEQIYPLLPNTASQERQKNIYLKIKNPLSFQEVKRQTLSVICFNTMNSQISHNDIQLSTAFLLPDLPKYIARLDIEGLLQMGKVECFNQAIDLSIRHQVFCKYVGFICVIKQNNFPNNVEYLLRMKKSIDGHSSLSKIGVIHIRTLTNKVIHVGTSMEITIQQLKVLIAENGEQLPYQQRLIFAGKQLEDGHSLQYYNITPGCTLHLVERLRGGGCGWYICIALPNGKTVFIQEPLGTLPIASICNYIIADYPNIHKAQIELKNNSITLDPQRTISHYNINQSNNVIVALIPAYYFGSQGVLKLFKTAGFWEFNEKMLKDLDLFEQYQQLLDKYGKPQKAMTAALIHYLEDQFHNEVDELKLVIQKANKYLSK